MTRTGTRGAAWQSRSQAVDASLRGTLGTGAGCSRGAQDRPPRPQVPRSPLPRSHRGSLPPRRPPLTLDGGRSGGSGQTSGQISGQTSGRTSLHSRRGPGSPTPDPPAQDPPPVGLSGSRGGGAGVRVWRSSFVGAIVGQRGPEASQTPSPADPCLRGSGAPDQGEPASGPSVRQGQGRPVVGGPGRGQDALLVLQPGVHSWEGGREGKGAPEAGASGTSVVGGERGRRGPSGAGATPSTRTGMTLRWCSWRT